MYQRMWEFKFTPPGRGLWAMSVDVLEKKLGAVLNNCAFVTTENIDKEFLRLWFRKHCDPYNDPELPKAPDELIVELSSRYIRLYEMITGQEFTVDTTKPIKERIIQHLTSEGIL